MQSTRLKAGNFLSIHTYKIEIIPDKLDQTLSVCVCVRAHACACVRAHALACVFVCFCTGACAYVCLFTGCPKSHFTKIVK
jgi:hypothetical protein